MATHFRVTLIIPANQLTPLVELINPEGEVREIVPAPAENGARRKVHRAKSSVRNVMPGKRGVDLLVRLLEAKPMNSRDLAKAFATEGRSANSASPILSRLYAEGKARQNEDGTWSLVR